MAIIGIDCGATKIEFILTDDKIKSPKKVIRKKTPTDKTYKEFIDLLVKNINHLKELSEDKVYKIGIGVPGISDPKSQLIKKSSISAILEKNIAKDIKEKTNIETKLANDTRCFALAEAVLGAGKNYNSVVGLILGTGCAFGYVNNKKLFLGKYGKSGEIGHWVVNPMGVKCYCGKIGCLETLVAGRALERIYFEKSGHKKNASQIYEMYQNKDHTACLVFEVYLDHFGLLVSHICNLFDPELIVVGGGLSNMECLYDEGVKRVKKYIFGDYFETKIVKNKLGDSSGVMGSCLL